MSTLIQSNGCHIEQDCTIEHNVQSFESGGSFVGKRKDGKHGGILYHYPNTRQVGTWDGSTKVNISRYGRKYRGNMGDERQVCYFIWKGIWFIGRMAGDNDIVRCVEIKG